MKRWLSRVLTPWRRPGEIHEEIQSHLEMRKEWNTAAGLPSREAHFAARRQFGNAALVAEEVHNVHRPAWLGALAQDARYGVRSFLRTPVFTLAAVITIALGVGASTAVFSVVDRILFRPLPYAEPERLVSVGMLAPADTNEFLMAPAYLDMRDRQSPFSSMASFGFVSPCDLTEANPARVRCGRVDAAFLPTFGITLLAGRNFTAAEDVPHAARVVLLAYDFWTSRFGGDRGIIGRSISIDEQPATIIGVLPQDFELFNLAHIDFLMPEQLLPSENQRAVRAFARLKAGVSVEQARSALAPLFAEEVRQLPPQFGSKAALVVRPLRDRQIAGVRTASWALLVAVLLVLLMACANVANLLLARSSSRRRELAVRYALGAGRARLVRQALTESLLLAAAGAAAGCGLAWALLRVFVTTTPNGITRLEQATLDIRVLGFAILLSLVAGVLFGLAPALERPHGEALSGGRSVASFRGILRQGLIATQIAASLILLTGASLLLRTLWRMEQVPLGLDPDHVVTARFVLSKSYRAARILAFYQGLEAQIGRLPGAAAISDSVPPYGGTAATPFSALSVEGRPRLPEGVGGGVAWRYITPEYFTALGIPILRGRGFDGQDRTPGAAAIILNQTLAKRLFGSSDPIGQKMFPSDKGQWHTVVGVAGDVRNRGLGQPADPEYYVVRKPAGDEIFGDGSGVRSASVLVRSPGQEESASRAIRRLIGELDPALPVTVETMQERVRGMTDGPRFNAMLLGGFAITGLVLAAIGIYGVIAFLVSQRTREIGIRLALGASPRMVIGLFLAHAARWATAGLCVGAAGSLAAAGLIRSLLFDAGTRDWWSLAVAATVLSAVALLAAWLPARRASRVDPATTLRVE